MSFAGFNSSKFVKGRIQAALYFMRKKNRLARQEKPEEPKNLVPPENKKEGE